VARRVLLATIAAAALAGCGLGAGGEEDGVRLIITERFGSRSLIEREVPAASGDETVLDLLRAHAPASAARGRWFGYVNGVEPERAAAAAEVHAGDRIWWDRHDAGAARARAVVGSFPEPFLHGIDGKRLPVRVECTEARSDACDAATESLTRLGVVAARGGLQTSLTMETLRVLVGTWEQLRADGTAARLELGPRASGVYARPARDGRAIAALDARGRVTRTLRAGTGLVAATAHADGRPVWIVTGTDARGLRAAADALSEDVLGDHFALAIADGLGVGLPDVRAPAGAMG
jgi:hypothetical protein